MRHSNPFHPFDLAPRRLWTGFVIVVCLLGVTGCHHPFKVSMESPIRMDMVKPLEMTTEVTTRNPPDNRATPIAGRHLTSESVPQCRPGVALIDVDGLLVNRNRKGFGSMGENPLALFREKLATVAADPRARAVVLRINSPGGSVTAADIMRRDLMEFQNETGLPVIACLMDTGTGGAYYLATGCDQIVAHPTSIVGAVGIILNLYGLEDTMAQFNAVERAIRAGERVDAGSPVRPIEDEEVQMLQQIADQFHERFIETIVAARPSYDGEPARDFDGRVFTASNALDLGLVDRVGYLDDALSIAGSMGGFAEPVPPVLLYRRPNDRANTPYDITPNVPLQNDLFPLSIPGLERASLPVFLFVWQLDPSLEI